MINKEILQYYETGLELDRIFHDIGQIERVRTQELILRYINKNPSRILDIGGAAGHYSFWLSDMGHEVHLLDPVPLHIDKAEEYTKKSGKKLASITEGEARNLRFKDSYFDIVLLFGPLYHLTERADRINALTEARRVLVTGGICLCVVISRYASVLDGYFHNFIQDPRLVKIVQQDLKNGQHRNPTDILDYGTTMYFHQPEELSEEVLEAGLKFKELIAIDGFGWLIPDFSQKWQDSDYRKLLLKLICDIENVPSLIGMSAHIMGVAIKR